MKWLPRPEVKGTRGGTGGQQTFRQGSYPPSQQWTPDRVMREAMQRVTWVFRCVDAIASNQANLPLVYRQDDAESGAEILNHPLNGVLNSRSNVGEDSYSFRYRLSAQLLLSSKGVFIEVVRNRAGQVLALILLQPQYTNPIKDRQKFVSGYKVSEPGQNEETLAPERVIWIRKPHPFDPYLALTPLESAGLAIESDWLYKLYNRNFLLNDGRPGGLIVVKGVMNDDDKDELRSRYRGNINTAGRIGVIASDEGADFVDTAITMRDAAYIEGRQLTKEEILMAFGVAESVLANAAGRCVDSETEALTQRGWLNGDEITADDTILSMDPKSGRLIWSPIHEIYRAHYSGEMYRIKNKHNDFLVTPGHNWALCDGTLKKIEAIGDRERIRSMGDAEDSITDPEFSSAFVELVGWAVTEGYFFPNPQTLQKSPNKIAPYVRICQNEGDFADRIQACLKEVGARFVERTDRNRPMRRWDVRGEVAAALQAVAPGKVMTRAFMNALSAEQREMLVQTMIDADGARQSTTSSWIFTQKDEGMAEAFVYVATLAGYRTSIRHEQSRPGFMRHRVIVSQRKVLTLQRGTRTVEHYDGEIWCPRTDYGTFVARRNGRVIVTGNTFDNAEQERLIFWMETMKGNHLPLIARPLDVLDDDPKHLAAFDTTRVDVIQRAEIKRRDFLLKENQEGVTTDNEYRAEIGKDPLAEGGDTVWRLQTYVPTGSTSKGSISDAQDVVQANRPPVPNANGRPQDSPGNQNTPDPESPGRKPGERKPRSGDAEAAKHFHPEQVIPIRVVMASDEQPARTKIGPFNVSEDDLCEFKERTLNDFERWETIVERTLQRFFERQQRVVGEKVLGAKMRTWIPKRTAWKGASPVDSLVDNETWDAQLKEDVGPLLSGIIQEFGDEVLHVLRAHSLDQTSAEVTSQIDEQMIRVLKINETTKEAVQEVVQLGLDLDETPDQLAARVDRVFADALSYRAQRISITEVVAAAAAGKLLAGKQYVATSLAATGTDDVGSAGETHSLQKMWVTLGDSHVRPTHEFLDGKVVGLDETFKVEDVTMMYPGDLSAPTDEVVGCRCSLAIVLDGEPLLS